MSDEPDYKALFESEQKLRLEAVEFVELYKASKAKLEIERLTAARDSWKKIAERLEEEHLELIACLRELADFSVNDSHYQYRDQSEQARAAAYVLLKRFNG